MQLKGFKYRLSVCFDCIDFKIDGLDVGELFPEYYKELADCYTSIESFNVDGNSFVENELYTMREKRLLELEDSGVVIHIKCL